ncbi:hypothetical protein [Streptomyces sp. NPDC026659]|uniref:hypothetical protein n=1 Tax=Streptomyces sp. NPDC026659 TaxID=3155123 RepID=UPI0033F02B7D
MDRQTLHALIDAGLDAIECEGCKTEYLSRVAAHALNTVATHAANEAAIKVRNRELSPMEAFDFLTSNVAPVYELAGYPIPEDEREYVRKRLEFVLSSGLN